MFSFPPTASLDFWQEEIMALRSRTSAQANTLGFKLSRLQDIFMATYKSNWLWKTCQTAALFISCHCPKEFRCDTPLDSIGHRCAHLKWPSAPASSFLHCRRAISLTCFLLKKWKLIINRVAARVFGILEASQLCWYCHICFTNHLQLSCCKCCSSKFKTLSLPTKYKNRSLCVALFICFCVQDSYVFPLNPKRKLWPGWSGMHWKITARS